MYINVFLCIIRFMVYAGETKLNDTYLLGEKSTYCIPQNYLALHFDAQWLGMYYQQHFKLVKHKKMTTLLSLKYNHDNMM